VSSDEGNCLVDTISFEPRLVNNEKGMNRHYATFAMLLFAAIVLMASLVRAQTMPAARPSADVASWAAATDVGIPQMLWVTGVGTPKQARPEVVADELAKRPAGGRVLLILAVVKNQPKDPAEFLAFGLDDYAGRKYFASLFRTLADRGVRPDFIVLDEEWGYTNWDLFAQPSDADAVKAAERLFADPRVRAVMPEQIATMKPQSLRGPSWFAPGNPSVTAWNAWTSQLRHDALDRLIYAQARAVWPGFKEYGNYEEINAKFPAPDLNGWASASLKGITWSCPSLYLNCGNAVSADRGYKKHPLWNNLIRTINVARSCAAAGPTRAWVSYPSYAGDDRRLYPPQVMRALWTQQIRHLAASNVKFIYWNPVGADKPADDDALAAKVFQANPVREGIAAAQLVEIPYDADEIKTGDIVTRYADLVDILKAQ
jgi:hypothetical protein